MFKRIAKKTTHKSSKKNLPAPPSIFSTLGPSFILLGLALGSGELILWPYLAANFGLGILWGGLLGITFQYVLNTESMRYTLAWGESVFVGFRKFSWLIPVWFVFSTFIPWSLPGFSSAASQILSRLISFPQGESLIAVSLLIITGLILTLGKFLYNTMEFLQRSIILIGLPFMIILTFILTKQVDWLAAAWGLIGKSSTANWWFFPPGISLVSFLGAFAYSGAGGNLNLAQSYYIKEKGWGMGKFTSKISSLLAKDEIKDVKIEGQTFVDSATNRKNWHKWWQVVNFEHFIVFFILGLLTIIIMAVLAKSLVFGQATESGLSFLYTQASVISNRTLPIVGIFFLLVAALMLFSTQVGVLEASSRIISENFLLIFYKKGKKFNLSLAFYVALWAQILLGVLIYLAGIKEPRMLLTLSAVLNAIAMMVSFPLVYWLNKKKLAKFYQPSWFRKILILLAFLFFVSFVMVTFKNFKL